MALVAEAMWNAVRLRVIVPDTRGIPLADAESCAELTVKREIHRAAPSHGGIGVCNTGSDVTESNMLLTCTPGQGLSCSDTCGGYFLSLAGYVRMPLYLRANLSSRRVVLPGAVGEDPVSLPTLHCFRRLVQAPPATAGGPLHLTKVGPAGDSASFLFTWDHHAPPAGAVGTNLHSRMFLEVGTNLDRTAAPPLWEPLNDGVIFLSDPGALARAPWTQCMEPTVAAGAAAGAPEPVVLVGLPQCFRGLSAQDFATALQKINTLCKNGKLLRVIINTFSVACGRMHVEAVAFLDAVLSVLISLPPKSADAALPGDIGAALLIVLEDDLGLQIDDNTRALLLPQLAEEPPHTHGLDCDSVPVCTEAPSMR